MRKEILGEYKACTPQHILDDKEVRKQILKHLDAIVELFDILFSKDPNIVLNKALAREAIASCMCDVYRLKFFRCIRQEDAHKQAAFLMYWLAKIRPIQHISDDILSYQEVYANEFLAMFVGCGMLKIQLDSEKYSKYFLNLRYLLHYHSCSPEQLASEMFLLEQLHGNELNK
jgi:hypothetical protein